MAQQSKKTSAGSMKATVTTNGDEKVEFEPVKAIEEETLASIKGQKTFIYIILGLLAYLIFMVIPGLDEKVRWVKA